MKENVLEKTMTDWEQGKSCKNCTCMLLSNDENENYICSKLTSTDQGFFPCWVDSEHFEIGVVSKTKVMEKSQ